MPKITYEDKENVLPIGNRKNKAAAEDFNEIKASVNAIYDGTTEARIPLKSGDEFVNSSIYETEIEVICDKTFKFPPGSVKFGEGQLVSAAGVIPIYTSLTTGITYMPILYPFDDSASQKPFWISFEPEQEIIVQPLHTALVSSTGSFITETTADELINQLIIKTGHVISGVLDSSGIARFYYSGTTVLLGEELYIQGFEINTGYNTNGIVTAVGVDYFEISTISYGTNESGGYFNHDGGEILENVRMKFTSQSSGKAIYYYPDENGWNNDIGNDLTSDNYGNIIIAFLDAPLALFAATTVINEYKTDSGPILGNGSIPWYAAVVQVGSFENIATEPWVDDKTFMACLAGSNTNTIIVPTTAITLTINSIEDISNIEFDTGTGIATILKDGCYTLSAILNLYVSTAGNYIEIWIEIYNEGTMTWDLVPDTGYKRYLSTASEGGIIFTRIRNVTAGTQLRLRALSSSATQVQLLATNLTNGVLVPSLVFAVKN